MSAQYGALRSSDLVDSQVIKVKSRGMDQRVRANRAKDHFMLYFQLAIFNSVMNL